MAGCAFCRIVAGEVDAHRVLEDERFVAFLDARPLFAGHTLLVPRDHVETLMDAPRDLLGPLAERTQDLARAVEQAMGAAGIFTAVNNRVSQSVPHLHVHVVPRRRKDGLRGFFWPRHKYEGDAHAAETQLALKKAVEEVRRAGGGAAGATANR
jgi:histidine triad (HIT) family protein